MEIICDNLEFVEKLGYEDVDWQRPDSQLSDDILPILHNLIEDKGKFYADLPGLGKWNYLVAVREAPRSQYDVLTEAMKSGSLPDKLLCMAGTGKKFHGFRNRPWSSHYGNLHLSAFLSPNRPFDRFLTAFTILSAVSVVETIDMMSGLTEKAGIKWINDIFMGGRKVSGFLVNTQAQGDKITGVTLGIGLNIETTPQVESNPYVPQAGCLRDFAVNPDMINLSAAFRVLTNRLAENYQKILLGRLNELIEKYIERSIIIGKKVRLTTDPRGGEYEIIAEGIAEGFGPELELYISGNSRPFNSGRLILLD